MQPLGQFSPLGRIMDVLLFVASAAMVAVGLRLAPDRPWIALGLVAGSVIALMPSYLARRRLRRLFLSGDVEKIVELWRGHVDGSHQESAAPLVAATAFAAYGWVAEARAQLRLAERGPASEATHEHRMFVEAMLEAFDGDREEAVRIAENVAALPVPAVGARLREQVVVLRAALCALARAFARLPRPGDLELLERVARTSLLVSWAMRYAAAIVAIDTGEPQRVLRLLHGAPSWPPQSAFRAFHQELVLEMARSLPASSTTESHH